MTSVTSPQGTASPGGTPLIWGYTLAGLHSLAKLAVHTAHTSGLSLSWWERYETAWSAIAEAIYAAERRPSRVDLVAAGQAAIAGHTREQLRHHGYYKGHTLGPAYGRGSSPAFQVYWWDVLSPIRIHSPETRIVERMALMQILPLLSPGQRDAITALAVHGDYQAAADSLGISYATFKSTLARGRKAFRKLWHEGELPSQPWGCDRRVGSYAAGKKNGRRSQTSIIAERRRRARKQKDGESE